MPIKAGKETCPSKQGKGHAHQSRDRVMPVKAAHLAIDAPDEELALRVNGVDDGFGIVLKTCTLRPV